MQTQNCDANPKCLETSKQPENFVSSSPTNLLRILFRRERKSPYDESAHLHRANPMPKKLN